MQRKASAIWQGDMKSGRGSLTTASGALTSHPYSCASRFGEGVAGTNPEELLAAAHAGCFTMALAGHLAERNMKAERIETSCEVSLDKTGDSFSITKSELDVVAHIPGADQAVFDSAIREAETGCPVSKLFKAAISVRARLLTAV